MFSSVALAPVAIRRTIRGLNDAASSDHSSAFDRITASALVARYGQPREKRSVRGEPAGYELREEPHALRLACLPLCEEPQNPAGDPRLTAGFRFKGEFRRSAVCSVSQTIDIDWSIFLGVLRKSGVSSLPQKTVSDGEVRRLSGVALAPVAIRRNNRGLNDAA